MLTCINATLWRHYEYGLKMPRQENLEKIAQALDVPMQMLFPIDTCTPEGIATLLLNMQLQFGSMEIVEVDGSVSLKFPQNEFSKTATDTLHTVKQLLDKITWDDGVDLTAELFYAAVMRFLEKWAQKLKKNVSYGKKFWTDVWTKVPCLKVKAGCIWKILQVL